MSQIQPSLKALDLARQVLRIEGDAVLALIERIDNAFLDALSLVLNCHGRVIVTGIGKSGHIGHKIAATLASTGTPAFFVHPAEASHGDLGMITPDDVLIALSNSGESNELLNILPYVKRRGAKVIAITGNPQSSLALDADAHLNSAVAQEACPLNLAPTASTTAALALGDALAVALLDAKGFGAEDFALSHPGGSLGRQFLSRIRDAMRTGDAVATVPPYASIAEASHEISRGGIGMGELRRRQEAFEFVVEFAFRGHPAGGVKAGEQGMEALLLELPLQAGRDAAGLESGHDAEGCEDEAAASSRAQAASGLARCQKAQLAGRPSRHSRRP